MIKKNEHMLKEVLDFPNLLRNGIESGSKFGAVEVPDNKIIVVGMGASGLVGDYLKAYFAVVYPNVEIYVYKSHLVPKEDGLYIIYTYSGNTLETLKVLREIVESKKDRLLVVTSGGKAKEYATHHNLPLLELPPGYQSRSHVPFGVGALAMVLAKTFGVDKRVYEELENTAKDIEKMINDDLDKMIEEYLSLGKKIVERGFVPVILSDVLMEPVPLRFRNQFSENSKIFSLSDVFPEIGHNLLCSMTKSKLVYPIILKRTSADDVIKAYYEILRETLENKEKLELLIDDKEFSWKTLLYPTFVGDVMSIAFAEAHSVDAQQIPEVKFVKKWLKSVIEV